MPVTRALLIACAILLAPASAAFAADTTPPTITVTLGPADGATVRQGDHTPFNWECADPTVNGETSGVAYCQADPADGVLDTTTVGDHTVRFMAMDNANNKAVDVVRTIHVEAGGVLGEEDTSNAHRLVLPSTAGCLVNPNAWKVKLRGPVSDALVKATAYINGRKVLTRKRSRLTSITLGKLPVRRFTLKVVALTASGEKVQNSGRYKVCDSSRR